MRVRRLFRPEWLILLPALASFTVWAFPWPDELRRGFRVAEPITAFGLLFLIAWYGTLCCAAAAGFRAGRGVPGLRVLDRAASDREYYLLFTAVALLGVLATYLPLALGDRAAVFAALARQDLNALRLATPYAPGAHTLRYAAAVSGGTALYLVLWRKRRSALEALNLILLLLAAAFASRLTLLLATVVGVTLVLRERPRWRPSGVLVLTLGLAAFLALTPLNYFRNAPFYRDRGVSDPFLMNVNEIVAYVGAPFQASVGLANAAHRRAPESLRAVRQAGLHYLLPTYLPGHEALSPPESGSYRDRGDVEQALTTNSVLVDMYGRLGWTAFPLMAVVAAAAAALMGHALNYRGFLFVLSGIAAYAFLETWRVYLFNAGILHFPAIVLVAYALFKALLRAPLPAGAEAGGGSRGGEGSSAATRAG